MPKEVCNELRDNGVKYSYHQSLKEVLPKCDILYMTRFQRERYGAGFDKPIKSCKVGMNDLEKAKASLRILHPLPRVDEIERAVDSTPHAYYFQQAENGIYIRQALLALLLGKMEL
jgi:aspartate carbamoyltransferase catalytic subunit